MDLERLHDKWFETFKDNEISDLTKNSSKIEFGETQGIIIDNMYCASDLAEIGAAVEDANVQTFDCEEMI